MLQKRLDYGFNGYHVPFVPRAARSARRRGLVQKKVEDTKLCAFDLLATVAGEILLEGDISHTAAPGTDLSNVQNVVVDEDDKVNRPLVFEHCGQGNIEAVSPLLTLELGSRGLDQDLNVKEVPGPTPDSCSSPTSVFPLTGYLEKNVSLEKIDLNTDLCCHSGKIENDSLGDRYGTDAHSIEDPEVLDGKSPTLVSSDGSVKLTLGYEHYPSRDNNVNVVSRDDDENSSECIQPSSMKTTRLPTCIGDRRIRKLFESKYRRKALKARDGDLFDIERLYRSRKTGYKRLRSQRIYPFKRKRFYRYNYCDKPINATVTDFGSVGVNGLSPCVAGQRRTFLSRESNVKLRIKSFRVPELFIEMSETSTIGSLKRTVMEAVSALLGGGLRVGVLLEGKKLRDDNRTLRQSGICHDNMAESLGFYLEPSNPQVGAPVHSEENSPVLRTGVPQPVSRGPITSLPPVHLATNLGNFIESDHDSTPSPADLSVERGVVSLHSGTPHSLAVAHSRQKSKRPDMGPRRIRRPFSVTEVESLVHAVEKLGTGRWRDVKVRGFDNVKHRTYVDLKDKWKTLVHTAGIAPQQRRGEPVPQELLDRVLAAHAYWTQHQSKQELKQPTETHLLF